MNKKSYLDSLLALCTEKQTNLFLRMYPDGPKPQQVDHAIFQIENTLKNLNATDENLKAAKKEGEAAKIKLTAQLSDAEKNLENTENELKEDRALIERLKNPINTENNNIQERLDLLSALEAGGVDNWAFYDESISNYRDA